MKYVSTRGGVSPVRFKDAVMMGLASDGGLMVPYAVPDVRAKLPNWARLTYPELAFEKSSGCFRTTSMKMFSNE